MIHHLFESRATKAEAIHPSEGAPLAGWSGTTSSAGVSISPGNSHTFLAFASAVRLISGLVGRLPLKLYQRTEGGGRETLRADPRYGLVHDMPNSETTSVVWREAIQGHACTWGNGYSEIAFRGGDPVALWQLDPAKIDIRRTKKAAGSKTLLWYIYDSTTWLTPAEVLHVPYFTGLGYKGLSPVELHREDIGLGVAAREMNAAFHGQGGWPGVIFERPADAPTMSAEAEESFLARQSERMQGPQKAFRAMVTQEGTTATTLSIPLKDAEHLASRRFSVEEMARIFNLPSFTLGEDQSGQSYNSLEIKYRTILDFGVVIWLVRWEQELNRKLLTASERAGGRYFEFDVAGFLRGDSETQSTVHERYSRIGVYAPNEIRQHLNLPSIEGGDEPFVELNRQPLSLATQQPEAPTTPAARILDWNTDKRTIVETRAARSLANRYKIRDTFERLLEQAAGRIVTAEVNAVRKKIEAIFGDERKESVGTFLQWSEEFFRHHAQFTQTVMTPTILAYMEAVFREIGEEMSLAPAVFEVEMQRFAVSYAESFSIRHTAKRRGQMNRLIGANTDPDKLAKELLNRVARWAEFSPLRTAKAEATRVLGAASVTSYRIAGVRKLVWSWPGGSKCEICPEFDGRVVETGGSFVDDREQLGGMWFNGVTSHPPAHVGCACGITPA